MMHELTNKRREGLIDGGLKMRTRPIGILREEEEGRPTRETVLTHVVRHKEHAVSRSRAESSSCAGPGPAWRWRREGVRRRVRISRACSGRICTALCRCVCDEGRLATRACVRADCAISPSLSFSSERGAVR